MNSEPTERYPTWLKSFTLTKTSRHCYGQQIQFNQVILLQLFPTNPNILLNTFCNLYCYIVKFFAGKRVGLSGQQAP